MFDLARSADEVAVRLQCVAAVVTRSVAEDLLEKRETLPGFRTFTGVDPEDSPSAICRWLDKEGLTGSLSPIERNLIAKPVSVSTRKERLDGAWRREALMVLEWAMQIVKPMPPADLLEGSWLFRDSSAFRREVSLRRATDISQHRDTAEFWLWRARTTRLQERPDEELRKSRTSREKLAAIIDHAALTGEEREIFRRIEGDFPAFGKPFRALNTHEWNLMNSISTERLHGLNWLCDVSKFDWDDVETNT